MNALATQRHGRRYPAAALATLAALAVGTSSSFSAPQPARAMAALSKDMQSQIATMSTGEEQPLVVTGASAKQRNDAIPLLAATTETLSNFAAVPKNSEYYGTAQKCLAQAIYYEAALEPELGQRAVAQVVLNRVHHPAFPDTVCGVVYQGVNDRVCQFSFTCDGSLLRAPARQYWDRANRLAKEALAGFQVPEVGTATNYHADYVVPRWAYTLGKIRQIGRHIFYRFPGSAGSSRSFYESWAGREHIPTVDFDHLRVRLAARGAEMVEPAERFTPGLTVEPDVKDRHTALDVGGRLDTTKAWRLTIPDPADISSGYSAELSDQRAGGDGQALALRSEEQ